MKKASANYYSWCIAYLDVTQIDKVEAELRRNPEWAEIEAYIPTVKILKKTLKNKDFFEEVPLLFNYGFFQIPRKFAIHDQYLENLKNGVSCIFAWVKDPLKVIKKKPRLRLDEKSVYQDKEIPVGTATSKEISDMVRESFNFSAHDAEDLDRVGPGTMITLRGYPWEGMPAEIIAVDKKRKLVKVRIGLMDEMREVKVSFDNVFYTIYHGRSWDPNSSTVDDMDSTLEYGVLDKKSAKDYKNANR
jgi:hypothetical protein